MTLMASPMRFFRRRLGNKEVQESFRLGEPLLSFLDRIQDHGKARIWTRGLVVLGAPLGSPAFVAAQLECLSASHAGLLQRIRGLEDAQASWELLLFCASPQCNHVLGCSSLFTAVRTNSHGATARALPHARSPQRVRRGRTDSHGATASSHDLLFPSALWRRAALF